MSLIPRLTGLAVAVNLLAASIAFSAGDDGMRSHRTQSGLFFRYPATWQAQENQGAVVLVPDDATRDEQGQPMQLLLVGSFPALGQPGHHALRSRLVGGVQEEVPGQPQPGYQVVRTFTQLAAANGFGFAQAGDVDGEWRWVHSRHWNG